MGKLKLRSVCGELCGFIEVLAILLFEFIVFNTHTTTRKVRGICCYGTKPELTILERLVA